MKFLYFDLVGHVRFCTSARNFDELGCVVIVCKFSWIRQTSGFEFFEFMPFCSSWNPHEWIGKYQYRYHIFKFEQSRRYDITSFFLSLCLYCFYFSLAFMEKQHEVVVVLCEYFKITYKKLICWLCKCLYMKKTSFQTVWKQIWRHF